MKNLFNLMGNTAGIVGLLICVIAGGARASGKYYFLGYEALTLFIVGMGVMVAACLAKLQALS